MSTSSSSAAGGKARPPSSGGGPRSSPPASAAVSAPPPEQPLLPATPSTAQDAGQRLPGKSVEATLPAEVHMDMLLNKLQLLNYEREFCRRKKPYRKGLTPCYFAMAQSSSSGSGNEQFFYFTSLAAWLLRVCGVALHTPKEFDDPNTTLQGIMQGLRGLGFAPASYAPTKLAAGWGSEVCGLLDALAGAALEARSLGRLPKTVFSAASIEEAGGAMVEEVDAEDEAADISSQAAAALLMQEASSSSSDGGLTRLARTSTLGLPGHEEACTRGSADAASATQMLVSTVDPIAWKLEVERVAPRLRANLAMRDWRQHLEAAHTHMASLAAAWQDARGQLGSLGAEVAASLEHVDGREQQLNAQLEGPLSAYRERRAQLAELQDAAAQRAERVSERNSELHRLAAALEDARSQLEARSSSLADASPLVRLKGAIAALRGELKTMELRIGVVSHNLVALSLADKQAALQDASPGRARDAHGGAGAGALGGGGSKAGPAAGAELQRGGGRPW